MAGVLAPFLAEHLHATGQDLTAVAATDDKLLVLAAVYARLPAVAQGVGEANAAMPAPSPAVEDGQQLLVQVNDLLGETADAIRHRLRTLSDRNTC
ncbi:hypothetical protein GCM10009789_10480 [Kribbella sancticallisti]|uniref:Uncharacterized protein n=2 Tax=Kribbella sancticallisti TaxID=460087 RepID=A0ABP4NEH2_9ACTN